MRGARLPGTLAIVAAIVIGACATDTPAPPGPTVVVAAETNLPVTPAPPTAAPPTAAPSPTARPAVTAAASPIPSGPAATAPPVAVHRSTMDVRATYDVKAAISVGAGSVEATTLIEVRNDSGNAIDRLELNTVAAPLGGIRITEATVDDAPVKVKVADQTLRVPLGRVVADGETVKVRIGYRARLQGGLSDPDWLFTRANGTLALHRWIPWVSRALPFDRPNLGEPFVTPVSPRVDVEIVVDQGLTLAAPVSEIVRADLGVGRAWAFSVENVRDVSVVLGDFRVLEAQASGVEIRVYARASSPNRDRLLTLARQAVNAQSRELGVAFPRPTLVVVETEGGEALETPGLIWLPRTENDLNRTYLVHKGVAHQWFYGLVGNDQRAEPFADGGLADFLARTVLDTFRPSRCPTQPLDRSLAGYSGSCYYEVVFVQGGLVLEELRGRMGNAAFWTALRDYVESHELGFGGTRALLEALVAGSDVNLLPILRSRFPTLY